MDGCSRRRLSPLHDIVEVSRITVDNDVLCFGYSSGEGSPIWASTVSRPCAGDRVNTFAEGEERDRKAMDENRAEDYKGDNWLNGHCQEFGLVLWVIPLGRG